MSISHIMDQRRILFWRKLQASSHVLLLASLSINEHIAVCSQYEMSAANVLTDSVKCCVWSVFEQSMLSNFNLYFFLFYLYFYISVFYVCLWCFVHIQ